MPNCFVVRNMYGSKILPVERQEVVGFAEWFKGL